MTQEFQQIPPNKKHEINYILEHKKWIVQEPLTKRIFYKLPEGEKDSIHWGTKIRMTTGFSGETIQRRRLWSKILNNTYRQIMFYCALQILVFFFFYTLKVYGNLASSESVGAIFPIAHAFLACLYYIWEIFTISNFFIIITFGNLWSVFDIIIEIVLGHHELHLHRECNKCEYSDCSFDGWSPISPSPQTYFLRHNIEIRPINNPTLKCSSERKSHMSLTLNQKPVLVQCNGEGMLKAKIGWKQGLLTRQRAKIWTQRKSFWRKLLVSLPWICE